MADVEGLDELLGALDSLTLTERKKVIAKTLRRAGTPIQEEGKRRAPRRSGKLIENIKVSVREQTAEGAEARIGVTDKAFYGRFPEHGTAHQVAKPWLGPAYDAKKEEAFGIIASDLGEFVDDGWTSGRVIDITATVVDE